MKAFHTDIGFFDNNVGLTLLIFLFLTALIIFLIVFNTFYNPFIPSKYKEELVNAKVEFLQKSFKKKSVIKEYTVKGPTIIYFPDGRIDTIPSTVAR